MVGKGEFRWLKFMNKKKGNPRKIYRKNEQKEIRKVGKKKG